MVNTNNIVNTIKKDIQKIIDHEQNKLNTITNAYENAEQFLLDNGYSEINEEDDVLIEIMKCIKSMKEQIKTNDSDIKNINNSIKSLSALSNSIDANIVNSLKEKIKIIEGYNSSSTEKLRDTKSFLETLLSLEIVCPACEGKTRNVGRKSGNCNYCNGIGVMNISTLLDKEKLLEVDYVKPIASTSYDYQEIYHQNYLNNEYSNEIEEPQNMSSKFIISQG